MIPRKIAQKLRAIAEQFPVIALLGPRQTGKTTLVKTLFPGHLYLSLEDLDVREFAASDPRSFLAQFDAYAGGVIDEIHHVPQLLSYIQTLSDASGLPGRFILTGSQNLLLSEQISQSLAGRVALFTLLPFSLEEVDSSTYTLSEVLFQGGYPRVRAADISPVDWYPQYIKTYVERDVRQIKNVTDLLTFQRFLKICAGRTGQLINWNDLAADCGVSTKTVKAWLSILEASYILFLLPPYHNNLTKRAIKAPKLYFYDTGLVCALLGIEKARDLDYHFMRGPLFESFVISELIKKRLNQGKSAEGYFWRDQSGREVDYVIENGSHIEAFEMKSGQTLSSQFFENLSYFDQLFRQKTAGYLVYGGDSEQKRAAGTAISWRKCFEVRLGDST